MIEVNYINLYNAWLNFRKCKHPSNAIDEFSYNLEVNLQQLSAELSNGSYKHGGYQPVVLYEKKRRDLAVATVRDRVVHRLLYDYLVNIYDKNFDPDVWSCRKGKGLHACIGRTQKLLQKYANSYVWRSDITKFYDSVNHVVLRSCLHRKIGYDQKALNIIDTVIDGYSQLEVSQSGIPIGNLTSQIFSNIYLHEFDRFVRQTLKPQANIRYGDDFVIFFSTRRRTYQARTDATDFLRDNLGLTINPKNDFVMSSKDGLKFLGHNITKDFAVVDRHTTKSVLNKLDWHNAASYKALPIAKTAKANLDWILLEKYVDV